jgi:CrcB protein
MSPLIVAAAIVAGAAGALCRYGVTRAIGARFGAQNLPRAVLIVNIVGSLLAGGLYGATSGAALDVQYILVAGFAGGLTTFSTWSVETIQLAIGGKTGAALRNVAANLVWGFLAALVGAAVVTWVVSGTWLLQVL